MNQRRRVDARPSGSVHGVLILDKPSGPTSHDVVAKVRRAFSTRRVGHAGTLDPMATGVLVLLLGEATKLSSVLSTDQKSYRAHVTFGSSTDTLDAQGKTTKARELSEGWLERSALEAALETERARELQIPPLVSAIKVDGRRAYSLAREGKEARLEPRSVRVHDCTLIESSDTTVVVDLVVSKGYYVRSFARDLAASLGVPGHLAQLQRTASGPFQLSAAQTWPPTAESQLVSLEDAARLALPELTLTAEGSERLGQGKPIGEQHLENPPDPSLGPLFGGFYDGSLVALVERRSPSEWRTKRGIHSPTATRSGLAATASET